jgi:hypothetical protein
VNRTYALAALAVTLLAASIPVDGPAGIALAVLGLAAIVITYRTRGHLTVSPATRAARAELFAARRELEAVSDRDRTESDAYLAANSRVIDAERPLKWWQRIDIEMGCSPAVHTPKGATTCERCSGDGYVLWVEATSATERTASRATCIDCEGVGWL